MTLDSIIKEYISSDSAKRLIIPGVGAFIKRGGGELVFVDILRADDGVLTGEVARREAIASDRAAVMVAKYAATLRSELDRGLAVGLEGLGALSIDGGRLVFTPVTDDDGQAGKDAPAPQELPENVRQAQQDETVRRSGSEDNAAQRSGDGTETVQRSGDEGETEQQPENNAHIPRIHIRQQTKKRKRTDAVMIIAILALLASIAAIIYGLLTENQLPIIN